MPIISLTPPTQNAKAYDILIESGACQHVAKTVSSLGKYDSIAILYDAALEDLANEIASQLDEFTLIEVPSGEASKSLAEVERIAEILIATRMTRQSLLINIGGGVITDLGGFISSIYMRGIDCLHIPTSLLSMVDASAGGKTGVDLDETKNILGAYHQPRAVIIDIDVLQTLPDEAFRDGLVEVVKIATTHDETFFSWLEEHVDQILKRDPVVLEECITKAVQLKAETVQEDERDGGRRLLLNFGHTIGHAIEALSNFSLSHGKAVSIGIVAEMKIAKSTDDERVTKLLNQLNMPTALPPHSPEDIWEVMQSDKKSLNGDIRYTVARSIGNGEVLTMSHTDFLSICS